MSRWSAVSVWLCSLTQSPRHVDTISVKCVLMHAGTVDSSMCVRSVRKNSKRSRNWRLIQNLQMLLLIKWRCKQTPANLMFYVTSAVETNSGQLSLVCSVWLLFVRLILRITKMHRDARGTNWSAPWRTWKIISVPVMRNHWRYSAERIGPFCVCSALKQNIRVMTLFQQSKRVHTEGWNTRFLIYTHFAKF